MEGLIWPRERRKSEKEVGGMDKEMGRDKREEEEEEGKKKTDRGKKIKGEKTKKN
jgi:hypothetical protein